MTRYGRRLEKGKMLLLRYLNGLHLTESMKLRLITFGTAATGERREVLLAKYRHGAIN